MGITYPQYVYNYDNKLTYLKSYGILVWISVFFVDKLKIP